MADGTDLFTLAEGITLAVAEASPYGATLADEGGFGGEDAFSLAESGAVSTQQPGGSDTGTLSEGITLSVAETSPYGGTLSASGMVGAFDDSDAFSLSDNGTVVESGVPTDAFTLATDLTELIVDDLVATVILTDATGSLTADVDGTDSATLADTAAVTSSTGNIATSDTDEATLAEAITLTILAVDTEAGTLDDGSALLISHSDVATLSSAEAMAVVTAASDAGTLSESVIVTIGGGVLNVQVVSSDSATLTDSGVVAGTLFGKPIGTVALVTRMAATGTLKKRTVSAAETLEPVAVGAGDL